VSTYPEPDPKPERGSAAPSGEAETLSQRVLVLEDNALIAMDAEGQLVDLGAEHVDVAQTVARALDLIANQSYEFALLDVNLGNETSRPVADALRAANIPFAFVTGYQGVPWATTDAGSPHLQAPIIVKPLEAVALRRAVRRARKTVRDSEG
jgi:CheY-like chemotaxis protein